MGCIAAQRDSRGVPRVCGWVPRTHPTFHAHHAPHSYCPFPLFSFVMALSRDTLTKLSMTLARLSGAKSLRDPLVAQLLGKWVASSPLAKARWPEATEMGYPVLNRSKQLEAVKQYASFLFPAPDVLGLLMELNVPKVGFRAVSEYMSRWGVAYRAATGYPFPLPIPSGDQFSGTSKEMAKPLELRPPVSVADPPASGRSWPLQSWARCVQSRPPLADVIDWFRPLTFLVHGDVYPCAGGSWTQFSVGLLNHGARDRSPVYMWVIGMAVCGDKDMPALATIWAENL